jgi:hypothetical protein
MAPVAQSTGSKSQRKAVYDFGGDNSDELSFNTGEVIQVVEEVDEGWWVGEINSPNGTRRGIFPVNYTEPMQTPSMPARPILTNSRSNTTAYNQIPEEPSYYEEPAALHSESPFGDANRSGTQSPARPVNNRFGPQRTLSSTTSTKPITPSINNKPAQRAPPPPPPASRTPPVARSYGSRTAPTTPHISHQQTDDYFESSPGCAECDCQDYVANLFKKGYCNNCFHKH